MEHLKSTRALRLRPAPLHRGVRPLLLLYGYEIYNRRQGTYSFMSTPVSFFDVRSRSGMNTVFTLDSLDTPALVLWAIQSYEKGGDVNWVDAPFAKSDPRYGKLGGGPHGHLKPTPEL